MADFVPIHPLGNLDELSADNSDADVVLDVRHGFSLVQIFARKGKEAAFAKALGIATKPGEASETRSFSALPVAPGQWLAVSKKSAGMEFAEGLKKKMGANGYVSEQGASRICIRVSGAKARELMSRGCRLDLHDTKKGFCAQTIMAQVGVQIHQPTDEIAYDLYVYSGFARSFWHWLTHTSEQFSTRIDHHLV